MTAQIPTFAYFFLVINTSSLKCTLHQGISIQPLILSSYIYGVSFYSVLRLFGHSTATNSNTFSGQRQQDFGCGWKLHEHGDECRRLRKYILFTELTLPDEIKLDSGLSDSKKDHIQKRAVAQTVCAQPQEIKDYLLGD